MIKKISIIVLILLMSFSLTACKKEDPVDETVVVEYGVLNPSFEEEMDRVLDYSWDTFQNDSMYTQSNVEKSNLEQSLKVTSMFGGFLSVWQVLPIEDANYRDDFDSQISALKTLNSSQQTSLPSIGDKVELSVDIMIDNNTNIDNTTPFLVYVESEDVNGEKTIIAESDVFEVNKGEWFTLTTKPAGNNGVVPDDSVLVVISYQINVPEDGIVYLDNTVFGKRVKEDEVTVNPNEEYDTTGNVVDIENASFENASPFTTIVDYSSDSYYGEKSGMLASNETASVEINIGSDITSSTVSAGLWVKQTSSTGSVTLTLEGYYDGSYHGIDVVTLEEQNIWSFLKTNIQDLTKTITKIKISVTNNTSKVVLMDLLQAGDYQAFNGNPEKLALIAYQPWYASASEGYGNWKYTDASDFDGGVNSYPSRIIDGQRDIASVYYPLIGVYDSSDEEVIDYHLDLIKAMNIDVIQVNYYADLNQNMLDALSTIFRLAEEKGLKVSVLYEPKIHIYGWIPHNTRMDALDAVQTDIEEFIDRYGDSKALLKIDNKPVIEIFGVNIIRNTEWKLILSNVNEKGYDPYLMGDSIQNSDYSSMKGMVQWNLYNSTLANGDLEDAKNHIETINQETLDWADMNKGYNIPIGIVYPGFDDSKILGWDLGVARKIDITGPAFYQASWDQFNEFTGFDWVLIATFNDWNEGTIIEPEVTWGHQMAIITQKEVATFKGEGIIDSSLLESITNEYLQSRQNQYD